MSSGGGGGDGGGGGGEGTACAAAANDTSNGIADGRLSAKRPRSQAASQSYSYSDQGPGVVSDPDALLTAVAHQREQERQERVKRMVEATTQRESQEDHTQRDPGFKGWYRVGDLVTAQYEVGEWYDGEVESVEADVGTYTIYYEEYDDSVPGHPESWLKPRGDGMEAKINDCQRRAGGIVLNNVRPDEDREVRVYTSISKNLKPHQEAGLRFMWTQTVESLTQLNKSVEFGDTHDGVAGGNGDGDGDDDGNGDGGVSEENKCGANEAGAAGSTSASACTTLATGANPSYHVAEVAEGGSETESEAEATATCGEGMGCILAHSMGLGKTLQVVSFVHTLTTHPAVRAHFRKVIILAPKNVVVNWIEEFWKWLRECVALPWHLLDASVTKEERLSLLEKIEDEGGILVINYEMYHSLVSKARKDVEAHRAYEKYAANNAAMAKAANKKPSPGSPPLAGVQQATAGIGASAGANGRKRKAPPRRVSAQALEDATLVLEVLQDPGPDLVVLDEAHLCKKEDSKVYLEICKIKTQRRIALTGTPMQNNLMEYHTMVSFVRPAYLSKPALFKSLIVDPINRGLDADSNPHDVAIMRKRAHVLHRLVNAFVDRKTDSILRQFLPSKRESTVYVKLATAHALFYASVYY